MASSLAGRALLIACKISMWQGRRQDKKLGEEAEKNHGTKKGTVKAIKYLVPKESLKDVDKAASEARMEHYKHTLAWGGDNVRIISSAAYIDPYVPAMTAKMDVFRQAARKFVAAYPALLREAPARLNGLYRSEDFPSERLIAAKFNIQTEPLPLPEVDDFRVVDLGLIQSEAEQQVADAIMRRNQEAMQEVYERVLEPLRHFARTMREGGRTKKGKGTFKDSTVEKLIEAAKAVPRLSLIPDANLEAECAAIIKELQYDPTRLRAKAHLRTEAAQKAEARMAQLEKAMKGMQGVFA